MRVLDTGVDLTDSSSFPFIPEVERDPRPRRANDTQRAERMSHCGEWRHRLNPATGLFEPFQYRCGYKECGHCGLTRAEELKSRLVRALQEHIGVYKVEDSTDAITAYCRLLGDKALYLRIPRADDQAILFYASDLLDTTAEKINIYSVEDYDWLDYQDIPVGKNMSGSLGKYKPEDKGPTVLVRSAEYYVAPEHNELLVACEHQVLLDTIDANPDEHTLAHWLGVRQARLENYLYQHNVKFRKTVVRAHVEISSIRWQRGIYETFIKEEEFNNYIAAQWDGLQHQERVFLQDLAHRNNVILDVAQ